MKFHIAFQTSAVAQRHSDFLVRSGPGFESGRLVIVNYKILLGLGWVVEKNLNRLCSKYIWVKSRISRKAYDVKAYVHMYAYSCQRFVRLKEMLNLAVPLVLIEKSKPTHAPVSTSPLLTLHSSLIQHREMLDIFTDTSFCNLGRRSDGEIKNRSHCRFY